MLRVLHPLIASLRGTDVCGGHRYDQSESILDLV